LGEHPLVGLEHEWMIFPNVIGMMIQSDFHIFQGWYTTNQPLVHQPKTHETKTTPGASGAPRTFRSFALQL
jgi:hypothetical protein